MYACICHGVTVAEVSQVIADGARTEQQVGDACGAGTGCGSCLDRICAMLTRQDPLHGRTVLPAAG